MNRRNEELMTIPAYMFERLLQASVGTLTIGSLMRGVLDIYGTSNRLAAVYTVLGTLLFVSSIIVFLINTGLRKASDK
jgi:predicted membrane protein